MYLSIDFEDFNHDLKRSLGIWETGPIKYDYLWEKYLIINKLFNRNINKEGKVGTFFCTGVIASKAPDLIKRIANDGHEIACHYNFHDAMVNQSIEEVYKNLSIAKNTLEEASGKPILGFRAPYFAIKKNNPSQYKVVEKLFKYDSSFCCSTKNEVELFKRRMNLKNLKIIPIFQKKIFKVGFKLGGSYLKLFPYSYLKLMYKMSINNGFIPHIYLHPYEFGNSDKFNVSREELLILGRRKAFYWSLRQKQWLKFRNESLKYKMNKLLKFNLLQGNLSNLALTMD